MFCYSARQHLTWLVLTSIDIYKNKYLSETLRIGIVSDIINAYPETYLLGVLSKEKSYENITYYKICESFYVL